MRILSLGWNFAHDDVTDDSFMSRTSALDFDVVFWNPGSVVYEYNSYELYRDKPSLSEHQSAAAVADLARRREEFAEILKLGRTLVVVTAPPQVCYVDTGRKEYSGTGRNRVTTRIVTAIDFLDALPTKVSTIEATGTQLGFVGSYPLDDFWRANRDFFFYTAYFEEPPGTPWTTVDGTDRIVGSLVTTEAGGHLLFVPALIDADDPADPTLIQNESKFIESLQNLIRALEAESGEFTLPGWTDSFRSASEIDARKILAEAQAKLLSVEQEMSYAQAAAEKSSKAKLLISSSGIALELEVSDVFRLLGCDVSEGKPGRDDLIVRKGSDVAVVEVKGVSGSAAEKHVAQLEKWASNYYEAEGKPPKPILVVNAFRDQPLHERAGEVFPDQLLDYATARGHCLVSGLQMLGIRLAVENEPGLADELFLSLIKCVGRYERFTDWSEFLSRETERTETAGGSVETVDLVPAEPVALDEFKDEEE